MFDPQSQTLIINDAESIKNRSESDMSFADFVASYIAEYALEVT